MFWADSSCCNVYAILGQITWFTLGWIPNEANELYDGAQPQFPAYPYVDSHAGRYCYRQQTPECKSYSISGNADYFTGPKLRGGGFQIKLFPVTWAEFCVETTALKEDTLNGEDKIRFTNYSVNYRRFRWPEFDFYWGLGVLEISRKDVYRAFACNAGVELYALKPISFAYNYTGATINTAYVSEHTIIARVHWNRYAVRLGYRNWHADEARLETAVGGLELFF